MATTAKRTAAAAKAAASGESSTYTVLSNLDHDGERYAPGEHVELDPICAAPLLEAGVVKPSHGKK
jgi:hypothetical protein